MALLGQPELADHPDYVSQDARYRHRDQLNEIIAAAFKKKSSAEWLDLLEKASIPAGPIYRMDEVFDDPQVKHVGMAVPVKHPSRGDIRLVGEPVTLSRTPAEIVAPIAEMGEHTEEISRGNRHRRRRCRPVARRQSNLKNGIREETEWPTVKIES